MRHDWHVNVRIACKLVQNVISVRQNIKQQGISTRINRSFSLLFQARSWASEVGGIEQFLASLLPGLLSSLHANLDSFLDRCQLVLKQNFVILDQINSAKSLTDKLFTQLICIQTND
ncbi:hypothetical protein D3C76_1231580 [compost metagenome]